MKPIERICLALSLVALVVGLVGCATGQPIVWQPAAIGGTTALAVGLGAISSLRTYRFTAWVVAAVTAAMIEPAIFQPFEPNNPRYKLLLLLMVQTVMFGIGTQMSLRDFAAVARAPWPVAIGIFCQFTIMPLLGYGLAVLFRLPAEIAAGLVLIGACSSGLASSVMSYIARANLALSIALSAVTTMLAPIITPFWFTLLAGNMMSEASIKLSFVGMMVSIIKIVIVPIGAALVHDFLKHATPGGKRVVWAIALLGAVLLLGEWGGSSWWGRVEAEAPWPMYFDLARWIIGGLVFGVVYHVVTIVWPGLDRVMPALAMFGIIYVTGMTTAEGRQNLVDVGGPLVIAAVLHNVLGLLLGYWMSRALAMEPQSARTISFEVGMQNGGMATGLAAEMGMLGTLGLPAAIFIAWMNVSGSLLANYWRRRPPVTEAMLPVAAAD